MRLNKDFYVEYDIGRPCIFDEGSPLVQQLSATTSYVVGIVSKNLGCDFSITIYPSIYTRLAAYSDWMLSKGGPQSLAQ